MNEGRIDVEEMEIQSMNGKLHRSFTEVAQVHGDRPHHDDLNTLHHGHYLPPTPEETPQTRLRTLDHEETFHEQDCLKWRPGFATPMTPRDAGLGLMSPFEVDGPPGVKTRIKKELDYGDQSSSVNASPMVYQAANHSRRSFEKRKGIKRSFAASVDELRRRCQSEPLL